MLRTRSDLHCPGVCDKSRDDTKVGAYATCVYRTELRAKIVITEEKFTQADCQGLVVSFDSSNADLTLRRAKK
jgi:hypothetical protein